MAIDVVEFKKRFGKKSIDTVPPEDRFKARLAQVAPKIKAGQARKEQPAIEAATELAQLVKNKDWNGAFDLLDDVSATLDVDKARATKLRTDLAQQAALVQLNGKLTPSLTAPHDAILVEISADRYDDADSQLVDFKKRVQDHLAAIQLFDTRLKKLEADQGAISFRLGAGPNGQKAAQEFSKKVDAFRTEVGYQSFQTAEIKFQDVQAAILPSNPPDQSPKTLKSTFETLREAPDLEKFKALATETDPVLAEVARHAKELVAALKDADQAHKAGDDKQALGRLDKAGSATKAIKDSLLAINVQQNGVLKTIRQDVDFVLRSNTVPASVAQSLVDQIKDANSKRADANQTGDTVAAIKAFKVIGPGYQAIWDALQVNKPATADPSTAPTTVSPKLESYKALIAAPDRAKLTAALNAPDADLKAFRELPGATKLLDDMVAAMRGKADNAEKQQFVRGAMKARFGLTDVTGGDDGKGLSTKALPRMYKLFGMLPPEHTTDNEHVLSVERTKLDDTSVHYGNSKKIVLKAGKTGREGSKFDDTTLHEIAHGVDLKFGFMAANGSGRKFGGWQVESMESVRKIATDDLGFFSDFKDVPRELLNNYINLVFTGSNPNSLQAQFATAATEGPDKLAAEFKVHPAVIEAAAGAAKAAADDDDKRDLSNLAQKKIKDREPRKSMLSVIVEAVAFGASVNGAISKVLDKLKVTGTQPDAKTWTAMAVHPAVDFVANVRLKNGSSGLWDQGDKGASRCAVNGRVYQEAYPDSWVSYLVAARSSKLCDYQFRHMMEWFAESYSAFFRGKLAASHPLAGWLQKQKDDAVAPK